MASRSARLLLLAIVLELFALVFGLNPFVDRLLFGLASLVAFAIGVAGLVVAIVGFAARE
jgi:hypothetical protein